MKKLGIIALIVITISAVIIAVYFCGESRGWFNKNGQNDPPPKTAVTDPTASPEPEDVLITVRTRIADTGEWNDTTTAAPGDELEFEVQYRNISDVQHNDVVMLVQLPEGVTYTPTTTTVVNGDYPNGVHVSNETLFGTGINLGSYRGKCPEAEDGTNAYLYFRAIVTATETSELTGTVYVKAGESYQLAKEYSKEFSLTVGEPAATGTDTSATPNADQAEPPAPVGEDGGDTATQSSDGNSDVNLL